MSICGVGARCLFGSFKRVIRNHRRVQRMSTTLGDKFSLPDKFLGSETTVWEEFIQLAMENKPLNLGQGYPDFAAPEHVTKALAQIVTSDNVLLQQYTRGYGHPRLVAVLSKLYSRLVNKEINPQTEMIVTAGAYEALYNSILGHVVQGDEVILIEPFFDCYEPMVRLAGGKPVYIPLRPTKSDGVVTSGDWKLDPDELAGLFNNKTKAIVLNTPHNPLGKVFTLEELTMIADLCKKWNVLCISDEVYEWLVFEPFKHVRMCTLPGMWERTISIGSGGKTFSVTGWKTGWAYGPANLIRHMFIVHQNSINSCNTPTQEAVAQGLELELSRFGQPDCYLQSLAVDLVKKRDYIAKFLTEVGMRPIIPEGGYFLIADWSPLEGKLKLDQESDKYRDYRFAKWMTKNLKLQGIPPSAFYCTEHKNLAENYVRYCFIKKDENLQKAENILKNWIGVSGGA